VLVKETYELNNSSDFEALDYLESRRSEREFFVDLETLLLEYLEKPSRYRAYLNDEGVLVDGSGLSLVAMGEKANAKHMGTVRGERVKGETDGLKVLEELYRDSDEDDLVILAMPPGTAEEGFGVTSMTNISLIDRVDGAKKITTYTVPSRNLTIDEHRAILEKAGQDGAVETRNINDNLRPDIVLASHPIRIVGGRKRAAQEIIAKELDYLGFNDLVRKVETALELENDPESMGRRVGLISYIAKQIVSYRDKQNREGLLALGRTVRAVFALEAVGRFQGANYMEMITRFKQYMHGFMYKQMLDQNTDPGVNMSLHTDDPNLLHLWELHRYLQRSPEAQGLLEASMCGGGGWHDMFNQRYGGEMADLQNPSVMQDILSASESKEEKYEFDKDGTCKVCKRSSEDVGKLGPCYICKPCDHKITLQVE